MLFSKLQKETFFYNWSRINLVIKNFKGKIYIVFNEEWIRQKNNNNVYLNILFNKVFNISCIKLRFWVQTVLEFQLQYVLNAILNKIT